MNLVSPIPPILCMPGSEHKLVPAAIAGMGRKTTAGHGSQVQDTNKRLSPNGNQYYIAFPLDISER